MENFRKLLNLKYVNVHSSHCPYEIINSVDNLTAINQKCSNPTFFSELLLIKQALLSFHSEC